MVGMTEIYFHTERFIQLFVVLEKKIIVGRNTFQFRKFLFDTLECFVYIFDVHGQDFFNEHYS